MIEFLIIHNNKEFYSIDSLENSKGQLNSHPIQFNKIQAEKDQVDLDAIQNSPSSRRQDAIFDQKQQQRENFDHLLQLIKSFFKKRMLDGKNLFKILSKYTEQDDIRWKIYELVFAVCFFCKDIQTDLDFYWVKDRHANIFNNSISQLYSECNPMLTKCIFQVLGEILKQFTIVDYDGCQAFICQDEIFMRKAHKINLNESSFIDNQLSNQWQMNNNYKNKNEISLARQPSHLNELMLGQSILGMNQCDETNRGQITQPSMNWRELSIDNTFNLTPKISPRDADFADDKQKQGGSQNLLKGGRFNLNTIQSARDEEENNTNLLKIEELENQLFTIQSENLALKKSLDYMENELANSKEKEDEQYNKIFDLEQAFSTIDFELKDFKFKFQSSEQRRLQLEKVSQNYEMLEEMLESQKFENQKMNQQLDSQSNQIEFQKNQIEDLEILLDKKERELDKINLKQKLQVRAQVKEQAHINNQSDICPLNTQNQKQLAQTFLLENHNTTLHNDLINIYKSQQNQINTTVIKPSIKNASCQVNTVKQDSKTKEEQEMLKTIIEKQNLKI
ncbi:UNKNOWN [Stylonychia lemnae]|uniref:Uncharacterized protein n=1 Tax=Stylonychia lemnae TaxID=5949 RepID=A0A078A6E0_STYLE|nr:UNKNOWN [Stylonychia lemnae]|eukprot:CDW77431.1 UNKNOWN [Stylonychia lemnae]